MGVAVCDNLAVKLSYQCHNHVMWLLHANVLFLSPNAVHEVYFMQLNGFRLLVNAVQNPYAKVMPFFFLMGGNLKL